MRRSPLTRIRVLGSVVLLVLLLAFPGAAVGSEHKEVVLAVVGPSGSGKSSLVRAGVVPALRAAGRAVEADDRRSAGPDTAQVQRVAAEPTPDRRHGRRGAGGGCRRRCRPVPTNSTSDVWA
jgi:hypothetical protein